MEIDTFDVTVYTLNGDNIRVSIAAGMSVEQVKQQILNQVNVPVHRQKLFLNNQELKDGEQFVGKLFDDVFRVVGALTLIITSQVFVKTLWGKIIVLEIPEGSTVAQAKQQISEKGDYPTDLQRLISNGKELSDEEKFVGSVPNLHLVMRNPGPALPDVGMPSGSFQIHIKTLRGLNFNIYISEGETVLEVKQKIFQQEGISIHLQELISYGNALQDDQRFEGDLLREVTDAGGLHLLVTELGPMLPILPGFDFEACMAHMELSKELRRLNEESKTEYGLAKALVDIELIYLQDPSQPRIVFDFKRPRPEEKNDELKEERAARTALQNVQNLEVALNMVSRDRVPKAQRALQQAQVEKAQRALQQAQRELQVSIATRNKKYIELALEELNQGDYPKTTLLLERYGNMFDVDSIE